MHRAIFLIAALLLPAFALAQGSDADFALRLGSGPDFEQQRKEIIAAAAEPLPDAVAPVLRAGAGLL